MNLTTTMARLLTRAQLPLLATDLTAVAIATWVSQPDAMWPVATLTAALTLVAVGHRTGAYGSRLVMSVLDDLPSLAVGALAAGLVAVLVTSTGTGTAVSIPAYARFVGGLVVAVVVLRSLAYAGIRAGRRWGLLAHPVVIVGSDPVGLDLTLSLLRRTDLGLRPVGILDDLEPEERRRLPVPLLGPVDSLPRVMHEHGVDDVIIAFTSDPDIVSSALVRGCLERRQQVFVVPRFHEAMTIDRSSRVEVVDDISLVRLRRWGVGPAGLLGKRTLDVTLSAVALTLLSPLLVAIAGLVWLEGGPGVIFRQERVGRGGRTFTLMKFRSMKPATPGEGDTTWNIDTDSRIGPVGRVLRRTGLDELPQLVNVLRGDMSLVGPRPERPAFVSSLSRTTRRYADRHRVATGLTGLAQVSGLRGDTSIEARVRADNFYIQNWSLWEDVKIMLRTVPTLARSAPTAKDVVWMTCYGSPETPPEDSSATQASTSTQPMPSAAAPFVPSARTATRPTARRQLAESTPGRRSA